MEEKCSDCGCSPEDAKMIEDAKMTDELIEKYSKLLDDLATDD